MHLQQNAKTVSLFVNFILSSSSTTFIVNRRNFALFAIILLTLGFRCSCSTANNYKNTEKIPLHSSSSKTIKTEQTKKGFSLGSLLLRVDFLAPIGDTNWILWILFKFFVHFTTEHCHCRSAAFLHSNSNSNNRVSMLKSFHYCTKESLKHQQFMQETISTQFNSMSQ